jgi:hypothetical protein
MGFFLMGWVGLGCARLAARAVGLLDLAVQGAQVFEEVSRVECQAFSALHDLLDAFDHGADLVFRRLWRLWFAVIRDALPFGQTALEVIAPRADLLLPIPLLALSASGSAFVGAAISF